MVVGIGFIVIGIFIYIKENYNIDVFEGEKEFNKKVDFKKDKVYISKMLICIFSLILGLFRIIDSFI